MQAQTSQNLPPEVERLNQEGIQLYHKHQFPEALEEFQKVLALVRELKDKVGERTTLNSIAAVYESQGQYPKAIETYEQILVIVRELDDKPGEGTTLNNIATVYSNQGQYPKALEYLEQALIIFQNVSDRVGERTTLNNIALTYRKLDQNLKAIEFYQQLLTLIQESKDKPGEGTTLNNIAVVYQELGQYNEALQHYRQALAVKSELGDDLGQGQILNNMAVIYREQTDYPKALEFLDKALAIYKQAIDLFNNNANSLPYAALAGEVTTLSNLAGIYDELGQYSKALKYYEQSLHLYRELNQKLISENQKLSNRTGEGKTLNDIGKVYQSQGQYSKSLEFYQQALAIFREIDDKAGQRTALNNIGLVYSVQGQFSKALELFNQALATVNSMDDKAGARIILYNIATLHRNQRQYPQAIKFYQQALVIAQEMSDLLGQETTLTGIGAVDFAQAQYPQALESYQQALAIAQKIGDRAGEATILGNIGVLLEQQNHPELAIVFYKQSVNVRETIRGALTVLPLDQQESYTQTVADTYRSLANLLLSQGRILEAQQVLELLKVQELRDFTRETRAGGKNPEVVLNQTEEQIKKENGTLIAFGQRLYECQQTHCNQLSQLLDQRDTLTEQFNQKIQTIEKQVRDRRAQDDAFLDPTKLGLKAKEIVEAQPGTILIYPLVLEDKIWLLWASKGGIIKTVEVPKVGQKQLAQTVLKFRQLLETPSSNIAEVQATGKQLYDWLILPIEPELKENKIQNLVFSLDRATRYIPMSALFDGKKYLIENYAVSTVLSADLTNTSDRIPPGTQNTSILALGLSNAVPGFNALPNVPAELDAIVRKKPNDTKGIYPGLEFLNKDFDWRSLRDNLLGHQLLHIATHGEFVPGSPDASYLLLGTGEKLAIPKIATLQDLGNISLVVLSACQTALGEPGQDGNEINGISYYFLNAGAKAVMASLWSVNDDSTRVLMQHFYSNLAKGTSTAPMTKAAALRQAQLSLLRGNASISDNPEQRGLVLEARPGSPTPSTASTSSGFSHPYYWAPFILMGNSL
jgi:CHAT domain-containing protein/Tfp pilus assembly protein PilF